jgi:D-alanyl-lipoteichoic acid acyltransferase DltB (MBOAT superfamily)
LIIFWLICGFFIIGGPIQKSQQGLKQKVLLIISLTTNLGLLAYFKYANFFIDSFINSFNFMGGSLDSFALNIILPVGISFLYISDLELHDEYLQRWLKPVKEWLYTFVAFIQLVAGT